MATTNCAAGSIARPAYAIGKVEDARAGRLGHIDVVGQWLVQAAHDVVVVVRRTVRGHRGDGVGELVRGERAGSGDLFEVDGRLLEVCLDLCAREGDAEQRVVVDVEARDIAHAHVAGWDICVLVERRRDRENRKRRRRGAGAVSYTHLTLP